MCKVCLSEYRKEIETELLRGTRYIDITKKYNIPYHTLKTHKNTHMVFTAAKDIKNIDNKKLKINTLNLDETMPQLNNLFDCISYVHNEILDIYQSAKEKNHTNVKLQALKQDMDCIALAMKGNEILASYQSQGSWEKIFPKILSAVDQYPEAKIAISKALKIEKNNIGN